MEDDGDFDTQLGKWISLKRHDAVISEKQKETRKMLGEIEQDIMEMIEVNGWDTAIINVDTVSVSVKDEKTRGQLSEKSLKSAVNAYVERNGNVISDVDRFVKTIMDSRTTNTKKKLVMS